MDIRNHCGHDACRQKRIAITLPYDLKTIVPFPYRSRRDICEHLHRNTAQLGPFEVNLVHGTIPQRQFRVLVTNEVNRTYFSGPAWRAFAERYAMTPGDKFFLWLEEGDNAIIFDLSERGNDVNSAEELSFIS